MSYRGAEPLLRDSKLRHSITCLDEPAIETLTSVVAIHDFSTMRFKLSLCLLLSFAAGARATEPRHIAREKIEWCDVWIDDANAVDAKEPRVLLIGDSITRGYYPDVAKLLTGKASVSRLCTSASIGDPALPKQIRAFLTENHFDVIHFNNGMHGWDYTEAEYKQHFPEFLAAIRDTAPGAKLVWATITPVRDAKDLTKIDPKTERVKQRNAIAAEAIAPLGIPTDDQFHLVESHGEYYREGGVHFTAAGSAIQAKQVAASIERVLEAPQK